MKVNFRDITITVKNKNAGSKKHFICDWEGFTIDVEKIDGVWECCVKDDTDMYICDNYLEEEYDLSNHKFDVRVEIYNSPKFLTKSIDKRQ